jgi:hypothetical protein
MISLITCRPLPRRAHVGKSGKRLDVMGISVGNRVIN